MLNTGYNAALHHSITQHQSSSPTVGVLALEAKEIEAKRAKRAKIKEFFKRLVATKR